MGNKSNPDDCFHCKDRSDDGTFRAYYYSIATYPQREAAVSAKAHVPNGNACVSCGRNYLFWLGWLNNHRQTMTFFYRNWSTFDGCWETVKNSLNKNFHCTGYAYTWCTSLCQTDFFHFPTRVKTSYSQTFPSRNANSLFDNSNQSQIQAKRNERNAENPVTSNSKYANNLHRKVSPGSIPDWHKLVN